MRWDKCCEFGEACKSTKMRDCGIFSSRDHLLLPLILNSSFLLEYYIHSARFALLNIDIESVVPSSSIHLISIRYYFVPNFFSFSFFIRTGRARIIVARLCHAFSSESSYRKEYRARSRPSIKVVTRKHMWSGQLKCQEFNLQYFILHYSYIRHGWRLLSHSVFTRSSILSVNLMDFLLTLFECSCVCMMMLTVRQALDMHTKWVRSGDAWKLEKTSADGILSCCENKHISHCVVTSPRLLQLTALHMK